MDTLKIIGQLRATGALLYSINEQIKAAGPAYTEAQMAQAEKEAAGTPPADEQAKLAAEATTVKAKTPSVPVEEQTAVPVEAWPHGVVIGGAQYWLAAPVNPNWKPRAGMTGYVFGRPGSNSYLLEPSNGLKAKPPQPIRSAGGWPLTYALAPDGTVIGTATIYYNDTRGERHAFSNDAEVEAFAKLVEEQYAAQDAAAAANKAANDAAWQEVFDRMKQQNPGYVAPPAAGNETIPPVGGEVGAIVGG